MASDPKVTFVLTCYADKDYNKMWDDIPVDKRKKLGLYGLLPCDGSLKMGQHCWNCQLCGREVKRGKRRNNECYIQLVGTASS